MPKLVDEAALTLFAPDDVLQPRLIPVEINLEGWPLFSRQKTPEGSAFEVGQSISTDDGRRLDQMWRVTASADFSLPGPFDEDVFVGVMALVKQRGGMPQDGKIRFSLYELIKVLGKSKRGGFHKKVRESLDRIASTIYYSKNAFYVLGDESLETYRFTLWTVHFSSAKGSDGRAAEHHTLKFDDIIIRSYNAGYLKLMDPDLYFRLKIPLAKALYRLVDQRRRSSLSWSVDVRQLRNLLVMSKSYRAPSRIWEVLGPAHRVLKREKFLESVTIDGDTVRYRIHAEFARDWYREEEKPTPSLRDEAITALVRHKVWPNRARALVDQYGPEKAFHALDFLEVRGHVKNRGGYVAGVIEKADPEELAEVARFVAAERGRQGEGKDNSAVPSSITDVGFDRPPPPPAADTQARELWVEVLEDIKQETNNPSLEGWFEGAIPTDLDHEILTLAVPNAVAEEYIATRFKSVIELSLRKRLSKAAALHLVVMQE